MARGAVGDVARSGELTWNLIVNLQPLLNYNQNWDDVTKFSNLYDKFSVHSPLKIVDNEWIIRYM